MDLRSPNHDEDLDCDADLVHRGGQAYPTAPPLAYYLPDDIYEERAMIFANTLLRLQSPRTVWPGMDFSRVLDIGTGTGHWAADIAKAHPEGRVQGADISPVMSCPPLQNLTFDILDCQSPGWSKTFGRKFTFIHLRFGGLWLRDPLSWMSEVSYLLQPHGTFEVEDIQLPWTELGEDLNDWSRHIVQGMIEKAGIDCWSAEQWESCLTESGYRVGKTEFHMGAGLDGDRQSWFRDWLVERIANWSRAFLGEKCNPVVNRALKAAHREDSILKVPMFVVHGRKLRVDIDLS